MQLWNALEPTKEWERNNLMADEISRALVRVPVAKHTQLATLLGVRREKIYRLVGNMEQRYRVRPYKSSLRSKRFQVMKRVRSYVQLTSEERARLSKKEGVTPLDVVRSEEFGRYIATMDVLVGLLVAGVAYKEWDLTIPHEQGVPYHAWLTPGGDRARRVGVYLLPHKYPSTRQTSVLRGIISKVDQKIGSSRTLYLVPAEHYVSTLSVMLKLNLQSATTHLLPIESFLSSPREYLNAMIGGENAYTHTIKTMLAVTEERQRPPQFDYAMLVQLPNETYRFIDTYITGDMRRANNWLHNQQSGGYIVPGTGKVAAGQVYVRDEYMREGLLAVQAKYAKHTDMEFLPWPLQTEDEYEQNAIHAVDPNKVLDW